MGVKWDDKNNLEDKIIDEEIDIDEFDIKEMTMDEINIEEIDINELSMEDHIVDDPISNTEDIKVEEFKSGSGLDGRTEIEEGKFTSDKYQSKIFNVQQYTEDIKPTHVFDSKSKLILIIRTLEMLNKVKDILSTDIDSSTNIIYEINIAMPGGVQAFKIGDYELNWNKYIILKRYGIKIYKVIDENNNLKKFKAEELYDYRKIDDIILTKSDEIHGTTNYIDNTEDIDDIDNIDYLFENDEIIDESEKDIFGNIGRKYIEDSEENNHSDEEKEIEEDMMDRIAEELNDVLEDINKEELEWLE